MCARKLAVKPALSTARPKRKKEKITKMKKQSSRVSPVQYIVREGSPGGC